jgi:hypothetical protein
MEGIKEGKTAMRAGMIRERAIKRRDHSAKYRIKAVQLGCGIVICLMFNYIALYVVWGSFENISFEDNWRTEEQQSINDPYGHIQPQERKQMLEESNASRDQSIQSDMTVISVGSSMLFMGLILLSVIVLMTSDLMTRWDEQTKWADMEPLKGKNPPRER